MENLRNSRDFSTREFADFTAFRTFLYFLSWQWRRSDLTNFVLSPFGHVEWTRGVTFLIKSCTRDFGSTGLKPPRRSALSV